MKNHIEIGFIKRPKGLKGEVFVILHDGDPSFLSKGQSVYLENASVLTLAFLKPYKEGFLFTFKEVTDRNQSDLLKGKKLFIPRESAESLNNEEEVFLATLVDFDFYNFDKRIGVVFGFSKTKAHDLIQVKLIDGEVVEVPWVSAFFKNLNHEKRAVNFEAPEELFDPNFLKGGKKS